MHGLMGGGWRRSVGHGHRGGTTCRETAGTQTPGPTADQRHRASRLPSTEPSTAPSWASSHCASTSTSSDGLCTSSNDCAAPRQSPTLLRYGHSAQRFSTIRRYAWTRLAHYISERHGRARGFGWWVLIDQSNDLGLISLYGTVVSPRPFKDWRVKPNAGGERRR
jgi:hypothetical protein